MTTGWYEVEDQQTKTFRCCLCFHRCLIRRYSRGLCGARIWGADGLESPYLGRFCSCAVDPVEKKPLRRWRPGSSILSLGSLGCNMNCPFCQNHEISHPSAHVPLRTISPDNLLRLALGSDLRAVAYTYNEPTLQAEYVIEAAPLLREAGVATVLVTNGLFSEELTEALLPHVAAANVDVKTFDAEKYTTMGGSLTAVKTNVKRLLDAGVHVELTNLVVPAISDSRGDFAAMVDWIASLSPEVPLHISRYFPAYRYSAPATDTDLLSEFKKIAAAKLRYVYLGNV